MPPEPDYRQSAVTGQRWRRALHVECDNGFGQTPSIRFDEEYRTVLTDGSSVGAPAGSVSKEFTDSAVEFPLLIPADGTPTGQTATYGDVYGMLWSLYTHLAAERDSVSVTPTT